MRAIRHQSLVIFALLLALAIPGIGQAQGNISITIVEPTAGAVISGALTVRGTATVPPEKQLTLRITATGSGGVLATTAIPVNGTVGQPGSFNISANFAVNADTPILIEVLYIKNNAAVANAQVNVTLHNANIDPNGTGAIRLALGEYEARVKVAVPMPISVEDRGFNDNCLSLPRPGEQCTPQHVDGKVVKLSIGGATYVYYVDPAGPQARLSLNESAPIKPSNSIPKVLADATAATGVKLYLPQRFNGPFTNLPLAHVDWANGTVTLTYSQNGIPTSFTVTEKILTPGVTLPTTGSGDTITIGAASVPIQNANGKRIVTWTLAGTPSTLITLTVPDSVTTPALADLVQGFAVLGSTDPGQTNPYNRTQFDKLTLALSEPIRSVEMGRQALLSLIKPARRGSVIAFQPRNFTDTCLQLPRKDDQSCAATTTPGYVIGVADTELFRYNVSAGSIRLNRDNSDLVDKLAVDYATLDGVKSAAKFNLVLPADPNVVFLGAQIGLLNNAPNVLLIYRDPKTNGFFSLTENVASAALNSAVAQNGGVVTDVFSVGQPDGKFTVVSFWASPEIGMGDVARLINP